MLSYAFCLPILAAYYGQFVVDAESWFSVREKLIANYGAQFPEPNTTVRLSIVSESLDEIDTQAGTVKVTLRYRMRHVDSRLRWNSSTYNGSIYIPGSKVWTPAVDVASVWETRESYQTNTLQLISTGLVTYYGTVTAVLMCAFHYRHFPYDVQSCSLTLRQTWLPSWFVKLRLDEVTPPQKEEYRGWKVENVHVTHEEALGQSAMGTVTSDYVRISYVLKRFYSHHKAVLIYPSMLLGLVLPFLIMLNERRIVTMGLHLLLVQLMLSLVARELSAATAETPRCAIYLVCLMCIDVSLLAWFTVSLLIGGRELRMPERIRQFVKQAKQVLLVAQTEDKSICAALPVIDRILAFIMLLVCSILISTHCS